MGSPNRRPLSVGLYLPTFDQPWAATPAPRWADLVAVAKVAEDVGFDSLWIPDHLLIRPPDAGTLGVWEGWTLLAAQHADECNRDFTAYSVEGLAAWQAKVDAACRAVGRDPGTLARSAAVFVDLPIAPGREGWGAQAGSPAEVADGLRAYARTGVSHVQLWLEPGTAAGIEAFAPVLELLDRG